MTFILEEPTHWFTQTLFSFFAEKIVALAVVVHGDDDNFVESVAFYSVVYSFPLLT